MMYNAIKYMHISQANMRNLIFSESRIEGSNILTAISKPLAFLLKILSYIAHKILQ